MGNLIDYFKGKKEVDDILYDPCCNNCTNGKRSYLHLESGIDSRIPSGVKCSLGVENGNKFDYVCDLYEKDEKFIAYNKSLEN